MVKKTKEEVNAHKEKMIVRFESFLDKLISSENGKSISKVDKISYWMEDWTRYLEQEEAYDCRRVPKLKRGSVIKVNLGFNVGNEEGGLHYAIVLDNHNGYGHSLITIVPLTSAKPTTNLEKLYPNQLFIGNELYMSVFKKAQMMVDKLQEGISQVDESNNDELSILEKELEYTKRVINEVGKMKKGSIVLIGQISTISKMRIYDPRNKMDVLKNIRVSDDVLDKIDEKLNDFYFKKKLLTKKKK